jgi:hypothetical protein
MKIFSAPLTTSFNVNINNNTKNKLDKLDKLKSLK